MNIMDRALFTNLALAMSAASSSLSRVGPVPPAARLNRGTGPT